MAPSGSLHMTNTSFCRKFLLNLLDAYFAYIDVKLMLYFVLKVPETKLNMVKLKCFHFSVFSLTCFCFLFKVS
jgi:hypothetical protein